MRLLLTALIVASIIIQGDCWRARGNRPLRLISSDGLAYTFNNGTLITESGTFGYEAAFIIFDIIRTHERRGSTDDQQIPATTEKPCNKCLEIQTIKYQYEKVRNATDVKNDLFMVAQLAKLNMAVSKLKAQIKFKVMEIIKNPIATITSGQTFTIDADLAKCTCMRFLDPGIYAITGIMNDKNQLVLSNIFMQAGYNLSGEDFLLF